MGLGGGDTKIPRFCLSVNLGMEGTGWLLFLGVLGMGATYPAVSQQDRGPGTERIPCFPGVLGDKGAVQCLGG